MKKNLRTWLLSRTDIIQKISYSMLFLLICISASAQSKSVSGVVVDEQKEAIIGASVIVVGTTNGTITDIDGKFTLNNVPKNASIKISYVGYVMQTISVEGRSSIQINTNQM